MQPDTLERPKTELPSGRIETLGQTTARARRMLQPTVSADALSNPPTPLVVPEPQVETLPAGTLNVARNVSRDAQGFISAQTEEAKQLRELQATYGGLNEQGSLSDLFKSEREALGATPEAIRELKDIQLRLSDMDTESGLNKVTIESGGQGAIQGQRSLTQEDREAAVRSAGLASRAAVIQGNIETATQLAKDAVNIEYQDRQLTATNLINQINMVQGQVDDQTAQLLEQEKRVYEAELAKIQEVKDNVANAMVNGASQAEISQLTSNQLTDDQKIALAQQITARGANQMRDLQIEGQRASIANSYSAISDRNRRFELDVMKFNQETVDSVREAQKLAATEQEAKNIENAAKSDKALGMLAAVNELATHPGLSGAVGPNPLARVEWGPALGAFQTLATGNKSEFKSEVDRLANTLTLENMDLLKGPATDKDVEIVAASMSRLKNMKVSEASYAQELQRLSDAANRIVQTVGATPEQLEYYGVTDSTTIQEADSVWDSSEATGTINFDY